MQNKDKDIKRKVAEYMEILGVRVPEENEAGGVADQDENSGAETIAKDTGSVV